MNRPDLPTARHATTASPTTPTHARRRLLLQGLAGLPLAGTALAAASAPQSPAPHAPSLRFRDRDYHHRWSRAGQHEFTPADDADLQRWRDMLTLNVHRAVADGEALATLANGVLANYQRHGQILMTRSLPRTPQQPAEHFVAAVLRQDQRLEAAFARCKLHEGAGLVVVASHRVVAANLAQASAAMGEWLQREAAATERALMALAALPTPQQLQRLPVA